MNNKSSVEILKRPEHFCNLIPNNKEKLIVLLRRRIYGEPFFVLVLYMLPAGPAGPDYFVLSVSAFRILMC